MSLYITKEKNFHHWIGHFESKGVKPKVFFYIIKCKNCNVVQTQKNKNENNCG